MHIQSDLFSLEKNSEHKDMAEKNFTNKIVTDNNEQQLSSSSSSLPNEHEMMQAQKQSLQELLKYGVLYSDSKPKLYQQASLNHVEMNQYLSALDLKLVIDDIRGLAFLTVADNVCDSDEEYIENSNQILAEDDWSHPLVRRQRLNMEQSLLLAILRQFYVNHEQQAGIGIAPAVMSVDEVQTNLNIFLGDSGSDTKDEKRTLTLLEKLKGHGIVSEVNAQQQFTIRPIIAHLANPTTLTALLSHYKALAKNAGEVNG